MSKKRKIRKICVKRGQGMPVPAAPARACTPRVSATRLLASTVLAGLSVSGAYTPAYANPVDGVVVAGSASISAAGAKLDVVQGTDRAVIDWRGFDIGAGEHTQFHQPGASSIALNRVNSNSASHIDGKLSANGQVVIVNQSGIMFGKSAQVDISGLIASTADIDNGKFMAGGKLAFDHPGKPNAAIVNEGSITAKDAGLVGLVAPNVINSGTITAKLGKIHLASGDTATVDLYGDKLLEVAVSDQVTSQLISNTGSISADGGSIAITAAAGAHMVNSLVNIQGSVQAQSVAEHNGKIEIIAYGSNAVADNATSAKGTKTGSSTVLVSGMLDASGRKAGEHGGSITVTGDNVGILSGSVLDASGDTGGGTINIGGDYQGKGTIAAAKRTLVEANTRITASALTEGNGGKVILWSDGNTQFSGTIEAKGGNASGIGGFVEVSGKNMLGFSGNVDTSAAHGVTGTLLLDPTDITISSASDTGTMSFAGGIFSDTSVSSSNLNVTTLQNQLANNNVLVTTASGQGGTGNLTVSNDVTWSSAHSLTLFADNDINVNANLTYTGSTNQALTLQANNSIFFGSGADAKATGSGKLDITLNSDRNASGAGAINLGSGSELTSNGGNILLGGGSGAITAGSGFAAGTSGNTQGIKLDGSTLQASGGNIIVNGSGYGGNFNPYGIYLVNNSLVETSGTGAITFTGLGTNAAIGNSLGIVIGSGGSGNIIRTTGSGNVTMNATARSSGSNGSSGGFDLEAGSSLEATGSGSIFITGIASQVDTGGYLMGVNLRGAVTANTGDISITGTGGAAALGGYDYGVYISGGTVSSSGGDITVIGTAGSVSSGGDGGYGINMDSSSAITATGAGNVTVTGIAHGVASSNHGITFYGGSGQTFISTVDGDLNITGYGSTDSSGNAYGVVFYPDGNVKTTGSGDLIVHAIDGNGGQGIYAVNNGNFQTTGTGDISIYADHFTVGSNAVSSAKDLTIAAYSQNGTTGVAGGSGTLQIDYSLLGGLIWNGLLTIGRADGTGLMQVGAYNWTGNVQFVNGSGGIQFTGGNSTLTTGKFFSAFTYNSGSITNSSPGSVTTNNADITLAATTLGDITLNSFNLTANGTGQVSLAGQDVTINASNIAALNSNITITALRDILSGGNYLLQTSGTGNILLTAGRDINFTHDLDLEALGSGSITLRANNSILYSGGGDITTNGGAITLNSDRDASGEGAISLGTGTELTSNGGNITLGGGATPGSVAAYGTATDNYGIYLNVADINAQGGNIIMHATGYTGYTGINAYNSLIHTIGNGTIDLTGASVGTGSNFFGIYISGYSASGSIISTENGNMNLTGYGSASGTGLNYGVAIGNTSGIGSLKSTGSGTITVNGTGGGTGLYEIGVVLQGAQNAIEATGSGNIVINGQGSLSASGIQNFGVGLLSGGNISAAGGSITVTGTGGTGDYSDGIFLDNSTSSIFNNGSGSIQLTGIRGAAANTYGIGNGGSSHIIGGASSTGSITLIADNLSIGNTSVQTTGTLTIAPYTQSTTVGFAGGVGTLQITQAIMDAINAPMVTIGRSDSTGLLTTGNYNWNSTLTNLNLLGGDITVGGNIISSSSSGTQDKALTLKSNNSIIQNGGTAVSSSSTYGKLNVTYNSDADASSAGAIQVAGTISSNGGNITLGGGSGAITAGSGYAVGTAANAAGVYIASALSASGGNIIANGQGYGSGSNNYGVWINNNPVSTTGSGSITLNGIGGNGTNDNNGIQFDNATRITTVSGAISLTGTGHGGGTGNRGIRMHSEPILQATGTGTITLTGTGANGAEGIYLNRSNIGDTFISGGGDVTLKSASDIYTIQTGIGSLGAAFNAILNADMNGLGSGGIAMTNGMIATHGGNITMGGGANPLTTAAFGNSVFATGIILGAQLNAGGGNISLRGTGYGSSGQGIATGTTIQTSGSGNIALVGVGGNGTSDNMGVLLANTGTITTENGDITVTGVGGGSGASAGVDIYNDQHIYTTGAGNITLTGTGANSYDIYLRHYGGPNAIGGASDAGNITFNADTIGWIGTSIQTTGTVFFRPRTQSTTIGFSGGAGTLQITQAIMDAINAPSVTIGRSDSTGMLTTGAYAWNSTLTNLNLLGGDITVNGDITSGSSSGTQDKTLTLKANNDIVVNASRIISSSSTYGKLHTVLNSDADASQAGAIVMNSGSGITSNGGNITLGGGANPLTTAAYGTAAHVSGIDIGTAILNANGGNVSLRGTGYAGFDPNNFGINISGTVKTSGSGTLSLTGLGGGDGTGGSYYNRGVNNAGTLETAAGALTVTGTGGPGGSGLNAGIANGGLIRTTSGTLTVMGTGATGAGTGTSNSGIEDSYGTIQTTNGSLILNGISGSGAGSKGIVLVGSTIGGLSETGAITFNADSITWAIAPVIQTTGNVTIAPYTQSTTTGVAGGAGDLQLTSAILDAITAGSMTIGRSDGSGAITANGYTWDNDVSFVTGTGGIAINGVQDVGGHRFTAQTAGASDITIGASGGVTSSASGNAIVLASARNFINNAGAIALSAANGRWLVYSKNASGSTTGGLVPDFKRFSSSYGSYAPGAVSESGNGFLYADASLGTISITANSLTRHYGDANPAFSYSFNCTTGCTESASLTGTPSLTTSATQGSNVGTYAITAGMGSLSLVGAYADYLLSLADGTLSIDARPLTITADNAQGKTYGAADPSLAYHITSGSLYGADSLTGALARTGGSNAGMYAINQGTLSAGGNYAITFTPGKVFTIAQRALTLAADALSKAYGATDPALTYQITSGALVGGDQFTGMLSRASGESSGNYAITLGTLSAGGNYSVNFIPGLFTIGAAPAGNGNALPPQVMILAALPNSVSWQSQNPWVNVSNAIAQNNPPADSTPVVNVMGYNQEPESDRSLLSFLNLSPSASSDTMTDAKQDSGEDILTIDPALLRSLKLKEMRL